MEFRENKEHKFINPYNFIALNPKCHRPEKKEGTLTGYMECELITKTPLIIISTDEKNVTTEPVYDEVKRTKVEHKVYKDTFRINKVPAIPGSELRGLIRNSFETMTNSCLSTIDGNLIFSGRMTGAAMKEPGLLDFSDPKHVKLYKAKKYKVAKVPYNIQSGEIISYNVIVRNNAIYSPNGMQQGVYKKGERFRGNASHAFEKGELLHPKNEDRLAYLYETSRKLYKEHLTPNGKKDHLSYTNSVLKPVWYQITDGNVYLSLGQNGQVEFNRKLKDVIPGKNQGSYMPCKSEDALCEGCQLFGTVNNDLKISGKVRVMDAIMEGNDPNIFHQMITLPELAEPKYSNARFYLKQRNEKGYVVNNEKQWNIDMNIEGDAIPDGSVEIRGRKHYWHHEPNLESADKTQRNCSVKPLKKGLKYTFKIYFDNLTEEQLEHLNMAISLGNDPDLGFKLGLGKPLGYGSVKINVKDIQLRQVQYDPTNKRIQRSKAQYQPKHKTIKETFKTLSDEQLLGIQHMYSFSFVNENQIVVDYPRNYVGGKIFEWFGHSKSQLPFADKEYDWIVQKGCKTKPKFNKGYKK